MSPAPWYVKYEAAYNDGAPMYRPPGPVGTLPVRPPSLPDKAALCLDFDDNATPSDPPPARKAVT